jgi:hypothetical protein
VGSKGAGATSPHPPLSRKRERARAREAAEPTIVVHSLDHARAALAVASETKQPVTLASAPFAGCYAGPGWFAALVSLARSEFPDAAFSAVLDCGDEAGTALGALRAGVKRVRFAGTEEAAVRLADIAGQLGAAIEREAPAGALDLLDKADPLGACREFLNGNSAPR